MAMASLTYSKNGRTTTMGYVYHPQTANCIVPAGGRGTSAKHSVSGPMTAYRKNFPFS